MPSYHDATGFGQRAIAVELSRHPEVTEESRAGDTGPGCCHPAPGRMFPFASMHARIPWGAIQLVDGRSCASRQTRRHAGTALTASLHARCLQTPILDTDVHIDKVEAGLRSRAAPEGNASTALALVTFCVTPSAESMAAELLRRRALSVSFASGVLASMERGHVDPHMVSLTASELLAEDHAGGAGDDWREIEGGGVGLGQTAGGAVAAHGRGSRGEGIVGRVKCVQYGLDDVDDLGCSALHWAALNDRHGVMKMLLQVESNRVESSQS